MYINGKQFTIGADPEIFVGKDGQFVSAHNLVQGTKQEPFPVYKGAVQVDGMALEFNIDPVTTPEEFESNLIVVQAQLKEMIGDLEFLDRVSVFFDKKFTANVPFENLMLGCEPDFNAYENAPNPRPDGNKGMRTAGGHIHVGGFFTEQPDNPTQMGMSAFLSRILDRTVGIYSVLWDKDDNRRNMYGQAGCYRPKKYGMEYRTMSNAWLFKPKLARFIYEGVEEALRIMFEEKEVPNSEYSSGQIRHIINTSDRSSTFFKGNRRAEEVMAIVGM